MAIRTNLIDGKVINSDTHFSKYIETLTEPGVIEGMAVTSGKVGIGKCWCPCVRTNNETVYAYVENFTEITIDTSGTGFIIVSIPQSMIDDGSLINEDGTGVATVEKVTELPEKNYLKLASINNGTITDERNIIKKVGELNMAIESLISRVDGIDERVQELEEAGAIDHLEEQALVGELYTSTSQSMFRQLTPTNANSTVEDCHVGDVAANTEIHIQRIAEGVESNQLKLKVKMAGSPTTSLKVEVRKGVQVNVSSTEAYWYGDSSQVLASGSVAYSSFSTSWSEVTVNLNNAISVDKGTLLDIVVYQESGGSKVVNASNYYILACDSTQWSEAFSFVSVNGSTRTRSKLMPYCISNSFAQSLLSKVNSSGLKRGAIPFGMPKSVVNIGEIGYIITYGIIRTSFINKDVYLNTSGAITDSSTNQFSYLGVSNAYGDVLFDGLKKTIKEIKSYSQTTKYLSSGSSQSTSETYTVPYDGILEYSVYGYPYSGGYGLVSINGQSVIYAGSDSRKSGYIPVKKGMQIYVKCAGFSSNYDSYANATYTSMNIER